MKKLVKLCSSLVLAGCVATPSGISVVDGFDLERYLGTWYEIARLDHRFERGLSRVSAIYSLREDGGIDVLNRGFEPASGAWKEAKGRAYPVGDPESGALKVSFFGPFYGGYNIIELDQSDYRYALVCGPSRDYLWILARDKRLDEAIVERLVVKAERLGFNAEALIFVDQEE